MSTSTQVAPLSGAKLYALWALQILLAVAFTGAAGAKFASVPMMVDVFDRIGFGQGFRYVTAVVEIVGAIGLLIPRYAGLAAIWLSITMAFAALAHFTVLPTPAAPALVLHGLCALVAWLRRDQIKALISRSA